MAQVLLKHVTKTFDGRDVIKDLSLAVPSGSFTVLVGPSGCGKSTTLRMIAGLDQPTSGEIVIDGQIVTHVEPGKRDIAMVFQNYALYPTMTVRENIEFGLKNRKVPKPERNRLIAEIAEVVGLSDYLQRKPSELSGGQRQRVALARAMVKKPKVFLMDEPLSNLDAQLRQQMRMELMELHKQLGTTFIYVTHDQVEAMSMGDQIVIMNQGEIQQAASPMRVYHSPANRFVATFIGSPPMNIVLAEQKGQSLVIGKQGTVLSQPPKEIEIGRVQAIGIRPEKIRLHRLGQTGGSSGSLVLEGEIVARETLGAETIYYVDSAVGRLHVKCFTDEFYAERNVLVELNAADIHFFDRDGNRIDGQAPHALPGREGAIL